MLVVLCLDEVNALASKHVARAGEAEKIASKKIIVFGADRQMALCGAALVAKSDDVHTSGRTQGPLLPNSRMRKAAAVWLVTTMTHRAVDACYSSPFQKHFFH